jgi:hypothetical protein
MSVYQCAQKVYWVLWFLLCSVPKFIERVFIALIYRYIYTLIKVEWATVAAGFGIGIMLSSMFWVLAALIDPSSACVAYVIVFSYTTGIVILGFFVVNSIVVPFEFKLVFPASDKWSLKPQSIGIGGFAGVFLGLSLAYSALVLRDYNSAEREWCELGGFSAVGWGFCFFVVGLIAGSSHLGEIDVYPDYYRQEKQEEEKLADQQHMNSTEEYEVDA